MFKHIWTMFRDSKTSAHPIPRKKMVEKTQPLPHSTNVYMLLTQSCHPLEGTHFFWCFKGLSSVHSKVTLVVGASVATTSKCLVASLW